MERRTILTLIVAAVALAGVPAAAAADELTVDVAQDVTGEATVTVTDNGTAVEGATVNVTVDDENATYDGAGTYTTDENGTVTLPAPNETVNVSVTAEVDNASASTSTTLYVMDEEEDDNETDENATDNFGSEVSEFVLTIDENETQKGPLVAEFVVANNPGNAPDHAGPKSAEDFLNETGEQGPPEDAGPDGDERGPPEDAGNGNGNGNGGGPPSDVGADGEDDEEDDSDE